MPANKSSESRDWLAWLRWPNAEEQAFHADSKMTTLEKPARVSHWILWFAVLFIVTAFLWAKHAVLDEVTSGAGKVIPSSQVQVVQNLEGGIVSKIFVKEGAKVSKNQIIMQIDDTRFSASYKESVAKEVSLQLKIARLTAETTSKPIHIPAQLQKAHALQAAQAQAILTSRLKQKKQLKRSYSLAMKELKLMRPLVSEGAASAVEVLQQERAVNDLNGKMIAFQSDALTELAGAKAELEGLQQSNLAQQDRITRTKVRSPVNGIVKQIKVTTIGGVVQPGSDLVEIVPLDDTLLIEAKIRPQDIGFISPNQKATVKISAYDFSIYGSLDATVEQISADTIVDEKDEPYYLIRVRTQKNFLGSDKKPLHIIPGMHATVDILTGNKTVLDYILKPILKARQNALRER